MTTKTRDVTTPKSEEEASVPDSVLISRINEGDMDAWNELMGKYTGKAFQIAFGILGQRNDAEEVAQDAFVRIYRALPKFRGDSEFSTWMYRIVVNQARNKYRWNKRRGAHVSISIDQELNTENGSGLSLDLPDRTAGPDREVIFKEWQLEINEQMRGLPSVNREALILRNVKNLSYEEIAEILGCKVGTVKSRIARAREELRKRLGL